MEDMVTTVGIDRLKVRAFHGVSAQERKVGNDFEVTVRVDYPWNIDSDCIEGTLNYAELIALVQEEDGCAVGITRTCRRAYLPSYPEPLHEVTGGYIKIAKLTPPVTAELASASVSLAW